MQQYLMKCSPTAISFKVIDTHSASSNAGVFLIDLIYTSAKNYRTICKSWTSLPLEDVGDIELRLVLRSEMLKATYFLIFLSVHTPDSWPAQCFSACQTQKSGSASSLFCPWSPITVYMLWYWWASQRRLISRACSLSHFPGLLNTLSGTWSVTLPTVCCSLQWTRTWPHCFSSGGWLVRPERGCLP